jgi:DNA-binding protein H-NS
MPKSASRNESHHGPPGCGTPASSHEEDGTVIAGAGFFKNHSVQGGPIPITQLREHAWLCLDFANQKTACSAAFTAGPCSRFSINRHSPSQAPTSLFGKHSPRAGTMAIVHGRTPIAIKGENMSEKLNAGYRDLLAQREALDEQIEALRSVERRDVIDWIFEQMALFQIEPEDLVSRRGPKKHSGPIAAKYQDPQSGATWSGRGRAPRWMADQDREKFLIAD